MAEGIQHMQSAEHSAADTLSEAITLFLQRNEAYGDNYKKSGAIMEILFPFGVALSTEADYNALHLFEIIMLKLTRFTNSGFKHRDSLRDMIVYAAILDNELAAHDIEFGFGDEEEEEGAAEPGEENDIE